LLKSYHFLRKTSLIVIQIDAQSFAKLMASHQKAGARAVGDKGKMLVWTMCACETNGS
jgi:hypothetical protein